MAAESTRIWKEARALLVPWGIFIVASVLSSAWHHLRGVELTDQMGLLFDISVVLGIPLLASLSFGNEFKHKTIELLLSQPVDRMKIWREKSIVSAIAVLSAALFALFSSTSIHMSGAGVFYLSSFLIATTCSATFWILFARSTLGGIVLNIVALLVIQLGVVANPIHLFSVTEAGVVVLAYSVSMLWLGWRSLTRFQMAGRFADQDLMTAVPNWMPRFKLPFRFHSNNVVLNLIRKELRLLRPLWLIETVFVLGWIAVAISFSLAPASRWQGSPLTIFVVLSLCYPIVAMFLAGSLSVEEERECGVRLWHMTLPFSIRIQWLTKLIVALCSGVFCSIVIPVTLMAVGRVLLGYPFGRAAQEVNLWELAEFVLAMFVLSFWCANAVRGMARAVVLLVAAGGLLAFAYETGGLTAAVYAPSFVDLTSSVVSRFQLDPNIFDRLLYRVSPLHGTYLLVIPSLIFAIIQSYSMFRRLPEDSVFKVARRLVPMLLAAFVLTTVVELPRQTRGSGLSGTLTRDVGEAVVKLQPDLSKLEIEQPISFSAEDLSAASPLTPNASRWLRNSSMTVAAAEPNRKNITELMAAKYKSRVYRVAIHLPRGVTCQMSLWDSREPNVTGIWVSVADKCE